MSLNKVVEIARGELGYTEYPPGSNRTKYCLRLRTPHINILIAYRLLVMGRVQAKHLR